MKTRDEMVYDFMLVLAQNIPHSEVINLYHAPEMYSDSFGDEIVAAARALAQQYLESL